VADPSRIAVALPITLGQFVKLAGLAQTGGDAKMMVMSGEVRVNDRVERRRGHGLALGDVVEVGGQRAEVVPIQSSHSQSTVGGQS
jgi:ribosome-associated protein